MSVGIPDRWVVVTETNNNTTTTKLFVGDYGPSILDQFHSDRDTWKLSGSIVNETVHEDHYKFRDSNGVTYICYFKCYGMSGHMMGVLHYFNLLVDKNANITIIDQYKRTI